MDEYGINSHNYIWYRVLDGDKSVPVSSGENDQITDLLQKELQRQERLTKELNSLMLTVNLS